MNFIKIAKLNSKANIFGISLLRSGISKIIQNYEKVTNIKPYNSK